MDPARARRDARDRRADHAPAAEGRGAGTPQDGEGREALRRSVPVGWSRLSVHHLGSKPTEREARVLRDWAAGELAAGRDPRQELRRLQQTSAQRSAATVDGWLRRWIDSRIDVGEKTKELDTNAANRFKPLVGHVEASERTLADAQEAVAKLSDELEPRTVGKYLSSLRLALDFAGLDRNPARDRRLRVPRAVKEEPEPPTGAHVLAILERVPSGYGSR